MPTSFQDVFGQNIAQIRTESLLLRCFGQCSQLSSTRAQQSMHSFASEGRKGISYKRLSSANPNWRHQPGRPRRC